MYIYISQYILRYNILTVKLQSVIRDMRSGKKVSNKCIAVRKVATPLRELTCLMGSQCYLPRGRGDIPALIR